jgi:branched-chain amino acid transport system substrate-binding protein
VKFINGMVCSGEVLSAAPITEAAKVIMVVNGSSPDISEIGEYLFRTWPSDAESSKVLASEVAKEYKKVAIINEQTEYSVALGQVFKEEFTKTGGEVVIEETFTTGTTDFRVSLAKIKAINPEAVFLNTQTGANAARIAKQARDLGLTSQFYAVFFTGDDYVKSDPAVEGTILVDVPVLDLDNPKAKEFADKYKSIYGTDSPYPFISGSSYDQLMLVAEAIEEVGTDTDKVKDYFYSLRSFDGLIGDLSFDENGDVEGVGFVVKQIKNGVLTDI